MSRARDIANLQSSKITADAGIDIDNITLEDNTISTTNSNGNLTVAPNGTGDIYLSTDKTIVLAGEGESATLMLVPDESDDAGDDWSFIANTDNTLTITNDISGSNVAHVTITPHATVTSSLATFAGGVDAATFFRANNFYTGVGSQGFVNVDTNNCQIVSQSGEPHMYFTNDGSAYMYHDGAERIKTVAGGLEFTGTITGTNITLGTTLEGWGANSHVIQLGDGTVDNGALAWNTISGGDHFDLMYQCYFDGTNFKYAAGSANASRVSQYTGEIRFDRKAGGSENATFTWDSSMRIDTSGRIGIGATAPTANYKMTIKETASENAAIVFTDTDDMVGGFCGMARGTDQIVSGATNVDFVVGSSYTTDTHIISNDAIGLSVLNGGNVKVATGNLIIGTSGKGIDFSATSDGNGTDTSELLDDYEEGTFTPIVYKNNTAMTSVTVYGNYTKVGDFMYISFYWYGNSNSATTVGGQWNVRNLPYDLRLGGYSAYQSIAPGYLYIGGTDYSGNTARWQANHSDRLTLYGSMASTEHDGSGNIEMSGTGVLRVS
jgi:hypothetical protein